MHYLKHAFLDSIEILPFIFVIYLVIEYLEHRSNTSVIHTLMKTKRCGVLYGALLGSIPQCGFSVVASDLFSKGSVRVGTLLAVFLSTSDEAIPLMLSMPQKAKFVLGLVAIKFFIAIIFGYLTDLVVKQKNTRNVCKKEHEHEHFHGNCENCEGGIVSSAIKHAVKIFVFVFIVNLLLTFAIETIGEDTLSSWLFKGSLIQPFVSALVGLIPNCAASVLITNAFLSDAISFGSLVAGLLSGAGVGLVLLFKRNKNLKKNLAITGLLYLIGSLCGVIIELLM